MHNERGTLSTRNASSFANVSKVPRAQEAPVRGLSMSLGHHLALLQLHVPMNYGSRDSTMPSLSSREAR